MSATLEQSHKFKLTVVDSVGRYIDAKRFTVTYQMLSMPSDDDVLKQSQHQNAAYLKLNYFISNMLDGAIAFTIDDMPMVARFFADYDNNFMVLPDLDDVCILEALHSKFSTLAGDMTIVTKISLCDEDLGIKYNYYYDEESASTLPTQKEWLGELAFWDTPWWQRYDILTFDNIAETAEERDAHVADTESRASSVLPLDEIDEKVSDLLDRAKQHLEGTDQNKGELISLDSARKKKTKWKPTVV